jgi:hypothetical protein
MLNISGSSHDEAALRCPLHFGHELIYGRNHVPRPDEALAAFFDLIGKYQWRMVAAEAWCGGEKKSGELCFE